MFMRLLLGNAGGFLLYQAFNSNNKVVLHLTGTIFMLFPAKNLTLTSCLLTYSLAHYLFKIYDIERQVIYNIPNFWFLNTTKIIKIVDIRVKYTTKAFLHSEKYLEYFINNKLYAIEKTNNILFNIPKGFYQITHTSRVRGIPLIKNITSINYIQLLKNTGLIKDLTQLVQDYL